MSNYKSDNSNMYQTLRDFPAQIKEVWKDFKIKKEYDLDKIKNIVITGLGGSAISGDVLQSMFHDQIRLPFAVNRNYSMPTFVNENSLVVACSYSGNTEETINAFKDALVKKAQIIVISTGGSLKKLAEENGSQFVEVPKGYQPRCALGLMLFSLIKVLKGCAILNILDEEINNIYKYLSKKSEEYSTENSLAYKISEKLLGKFPIIHSSDLLAPINIRFRCQLAENSKILSYSGILPELNHNEIIGWESFSPENFNCVLLQLCDENDHKRIKLRFEITSEILKELGLEIIRIQSEGKNFKQRFLDMIYLTDWISFYLAVINNVDPTTIKNINRLKESLAKIQE